MIEASIPNQSSHKRRTTNIVFAVIIAAVAVLLVVLIAYRSGLLFTSQVPNELQPSESGPIQYVAVPEVDLCRRGQAFGARQLNYSWAVTRIDNNTVAAIEYWGKGKTLTDIYQEIIHSEQFNKSTNGLRWIIASWDFKYYNNTRPAIMGTFIVHSNVIVIDAYYFLDDDTISFVGVNFLSCPG